MKPRCAQATSDVWNRASIAHALAMFGLILFAFTASLYSHLAEFALLLVLLAFIVSPDRHLNRRDPLVISMIVLVPYLGLSVLIGWRLSPEWLDHHLSDALYVFLVPFMVLLVAWALRGDQQRMYLVLKVALAGLFVSILVPLITGQVPLEAFLEGGRQRMMFSNELRLGLYSAAALLGLLIFRPRGLSLWPLHLVVLSGYVLAMALLAQALIVSQSRAAWLSSIIVLLLSALIALVISLRRSPARAVTAQVLPGLLVLILVIAPVAFLLHSNATLIEQRWAPVAATIQAALDGETVGTDAVGKRYRMWELGIEKIAERPWFGHGAGTARDYLHEAQAPIQGYNHFHNIFIHLLVSFGVIGLVLVMGVFIILFVAVAHSWRRGFLDERLALFVAGALMLFLLDSFTGYTISRGQGRLFIALVGGMAYSVFLWFRINRDQADYCDNHSSMCEVKSTRVQ